jgi:ketosteroid isomerase-like protein
MSIVIPIRSTVLCFFSIFILTKAGIAQNTMSKNKEINRPYGVMIEAYKKLDASIIKHAYTDSAYYISPGRRDTVRQGIASFISSFENLFAKHKAVENEITLSFKILRRERSGNIAVDVGYYRIAVQQQNGIERTSFGKFMKLLKRANENAPWKFAADTYSFAPPVKF